jgi:hypothetical protein
MAVAVLPVPAFAANAMEKLDQSTSKPPTTAEAVVVSDTQIVAQVFTPSLSGDLTRARVSLQRCDDLQSDIIAEIRPVGTGGQPESTVLAQAIIPGATIPTANTDWIDVVFPIPANVTPRVRYALVLRAETVGTCVVGWEESADQYTRGFLTVGSVSNGIEFWPQADEPNYGDQSLVFETYVTTASAPIIETSAPACKLTRTGTDPNGSKFIEITVQDVDSGLARIHVTHAGNLTLNPADSNDTTPPAFTDGTTGAVVIRATKLDQSKGALIALRVTDVDGNLTDCDPIMQTIVRENGRPTPTTISDIPQAEGFVMLTNGVPGVQHIDLSVNGRRFAVNRLNAGETRIIDVSSAMRRGNGNVVTLNVRGMRNASVDVLIWDGP